MQSDQSTQTERKAAKEDFFTRTSKPLVGKLLFGVFLVGAVLAYPAMPVNLNMVGIALALISGLGLLIVDAIYYPARDRSGDDKNDA
jgi:hypothetical protein